MRQSEFRLFAQVEDCLPTLFLRASVLDGRNDLIIPVMIQLIVTIQLYRSL